MILHRFLLLSIAFSIFIIPQCVAHVRRGSGRHLQIFTGDVPCDTVGVDFTCSTGFCGSNKYCGTYEANDECPFLDAYDDTADFVINVLGLEDSSAEIFQLPTNSVASNIVEFLTDELLSIIEEHIGEENVLLPTVVRVDNESILDVGDGINECRNLDIVNVDSIAFGFELPWGMRLCAAFNPCKHFYAFSQSGFFPAFTIAEIITFKVDTIGFSRERGGLVHKSGNKLFIGDELDYLEVPGHVYISGTGSVGIQVSEEISAAFKFVSELIIDADINDNGFFQPLGESAVYNEDMDVEIISSDKIPDIDFALLFSGTQKSAKIELKASDNDHTVDLGRLTQSNKKDFYIKVDDSYVEIQYAAGFDIPLQGLCNLSEDLNLVCKLFNVDIGISGRMNVSFNTNGNFVLILDLSGKFELDISGGVEEVEEINEDLFGGSDISFEGSAEVSLRFDGGIFEICLKLNDGKFDECLGFCSKDSDCADDKFCNKFLGGLCRPRRQNGFFPCIVDTQCYSGRCDGARVCRDKKKKGEPCTSKSDCSSEEFCYSASDLCRPKGDDGFWPCTSDEHCKSDRCVYGTRTCKPRKAKGQLCLFNGKECESGSCNWLFRCR